MVKTESQGSTPTPRGNAAADGGAGLLTGVLSGLFGVGGGIVLVPILIFGFRLPRKNAHATSLVAICITAIAGAASYAWHGKVSWIAAGALVVGGIPGARIGAMLLHRLPDRPLRIGFGIVLLASAITLLIGVSPHSDGHSRSLLLSALVGALLGLAAGVLSSLFGVGGGLVMVPVLVLIVGFSQQLAEGTSLAAMIFISLVGAANNSRYGYTQWARGARLGVTGALGAVAGSTVALMLPALVLQRVFALLIIVGAVQLLRPRKPPTEPIAADHQPAARP